MKLGKKFPLGEMFLSTVDTIEFLKLHVKMSENVLCRRMWLVGMRGVNRWVKHKTESLWIVIPY